MRGVAFLSKQIILANDPGDLDHDITFNAGNFQFNNNSGSALDVVGRVKQLDNPWVAGGSVGGLADPLTITADTWYHCFGLSDALGNLQDMGFDTDINGVNLLADANVIAAGLTEVGDVGSIFTDGSANILPFFQIKNRFYWVTRRLDVDVSGNIGTSAIIATMSTPLGKRTIGIFDIRITSGNTDGTILVTSLQEADTATLFQGDISTLSSQFSDDFPAIQIQTETNLLSQIRYRVSTNTFNAVKFNTLGWIDENLEN